MRGVVAAFHVPMGVLRADNPTSPPSRWVHYAPTSETFDDLVETTRWLLAPENDAKAQRMGTALKELALRHLRPSGLLAYLSELWRQYAALQGAMPSHPPQVGTVLSPREPDDHAAAQSLPTHPRDGHDLRRNTARLPNEPDEPEKSAPRQHTNRHNGAVPTWRHHGARGLAWQCTSWPAGPEVGDDRARCLWGNRRADGFYYGHNRHRGTRAALCGGACTCCRTRRTSPDVL